VVIRVRPDRDGARVEVVDHGIGIARVDRARVFERFYKVDRARVRGGGTGLGLAISRHIVAAHGGTIGVESEEGLGSTFWFTLPSRPPLVPPTGDRDAEPAEPLAPAP
jgi:two-component system sensor histidine kinase SenX3